MNERQILSFIAKDVPHLTKVCEVALGVTRQTVGKTINNLIDRGYIEAHGNTSARTYKLGRNRAHIESFEMDSKNKLDEHVIWEKFEHIFETLPKNVFDVCFYGFTEMVNNAIDHSDAAQLKVCASINDGEVDIMVHDYGEGIFKRIARLKGLSSEKESILELSKGKLTTDPDNHTGEGIYFTSRVFEHFYIYSSGHFFNHDKDSVHDFLLEHNHDVEGTIVEMQIRSDSNISQQQVFNEYAPADEFSFSKTVVPIRLAIQGKENLVSRSQAKRVLSSLDKFKIVMLDFSEIDTIGQAFADEIFRVFAKKHPSIVIHAINTNETVERWISRARSS